jgi:hypothetical protein
VFVRHDAHTSVLRDDQPTVLTVTAAALAVFLLAVAGVVALLGTRTLARVCLVVAVARRSQATGAIEATAALGPCC